MTAGARTFGLETFAEPTAALPPPPVRHALVVFLVVLAAILHLGTAGWSDIHNGAEGLYAASAREMVAAGSLRPMVGGAPLPNEPPLLHWLLAASFKLFGVSVVAARVPVAIAFIATIALTFLIGERLAGYWRGFVAGLIYLCSCGAYLWGSLVTPEPVFAACVAAAIYCALAGYQQKRTRRAWFVAFAACLGAAYLARGAFSLLLLAFIIGVPAVSFREARMRFVSLFHWTAVLAFAAVVTPWLLVLATAPEPLLQTVWIAPFAESRIAGQLRGVALAQFLGAHLLWWFPAVLLVLPGAMLAWRKVVRLHEFDFADALPLSWTAAALLPLFVAGRQEYESVAMWSGFALAAASAWDRTSDRLRLAGIALVALLGINAVVSLAASAPLLSGIGAAAFNSGEKVVLTVTGLAIAICSAAAAYLVLKRRDKLALTALLTAVVPIGLGGSESIARNSPQLSFAPIVRFLQAPPRSTAEILFEGPPEAASSLMFYLDRPISFVGNTSDDRATPRKQLTLADAVTRMGDRRPAYLMIHKDRVPWWQAELTARFHIYHQVTTCGAYVVVNNHP